MRWVCEDAGQSSGLSWGHAHGHKLPAAPTSLLVIQQGKHQDMNVGGNAGVQMTIEQKTPSPTLGRKPGMSE